MLRHVQLGNHGTDSTKAFLERTLEPI